LNLPGHQSRAGSARLVLQIYLFMVLTILAIGLVIGMIGIFVVGPPQFVLPLARYVVSSMAAHLDEPEAMRKEADQIRKEGNARITLYDIGGRLIVSNVSPPIPPLPPDQLKRLRSESEFSNGMPPTEVVGIRGSAGISAYGLIMIPPPFEGSGNVVLPIVLVLLGIAVASIVLSRSLVKPITRLSRTAEAFGSGNLGARVQMNRRDAFGELGAAFDEMADRIAVLIQSQKELMANVSHELRTPLARIRVALDIADLGDSEQAGAQLTEIAEDMGELERLVNDILMAARLDLENGQIDRVNPPMRMKSVDPQSIIAAASDRFRKNHPGHRLEIAIVPPLPVIEADPMLLRRVIDNLLDNAGKYSDAESVVQVRAQGNDGKLAIEIEDQGIGIDEADLPNVFKPFFRTDPSRARTTGGVGLGLPLSRRIVESHGGTITLESRKGEGTIVRFSVPEVHGS